MSVVVLVVDIAGTEYELVTNPMWREFAELLVLELSRQPTMNVKKARIVDYDEEEGD